MTSEILEHFRALPKGKQIKLYDELLQIVAIMATDISSLAASEQPRQQVPPCQFGEN